ncbi:GNAT family N-acetyltransferase [Telluribacter sp.]|jgi:GNAT superfamily N-acetyltransferase|uniref:GNAT family N-acetyltransferase n=1 Tax=Telluribacter sp. TaxID=1978767 RepID=UPI002E0D2DE0|nr:GNAT family N-acetyltransferase [Telluribacter sp.]
MLFRQALISDFPATMKVRLAVRENILSNPDLVTVAHFESILRTGGRGWVCETDGELVGFSIVDIRQRIVWALFVSPDYEKRGIGKTLHDLMLTWSFEQDIEELTLSTQPGSRAEVFYSKAGWTRKDRLLNGEVQFVMTKNQWLSLNTSGLP